MRRMEPWLLSAAVSCNFSAPHCPLPSRLHHRPMSLHVSDLKALYTFIPSGNRQKVVSPFLSDTRDLHTPSCLPQKHGIAGQAGSSLPVWSEFFRCFSMTGLFYHILQGEFPVRKLPCNDPELSQDFGSGLIHALLNGILCGQSLLNQGLQ